METPPQQGAQGEAQDSDAQRAARLAALRQLADTPTQQPASPPPAPVHSGFTTGGQLGVARGHTRRSGRILIAVASLIILVALGATLVIRAHLQSQSAATTHPPAARYIQIAPLSDGLNCPVDIAWSPDGTRLAALGYSGHCPDWPPDAAYTSGLLLIYNASTGKVEQRALLDPLVTGGGLALDTHAEYLAYQALMWSPDGGRLALPFFAQRGLLTSGPPSVHEADPTTQPHPTTAGVLLLDAATLQRTELVTAPYTTTVTAGAALEWNLLTGKLIQSALQLPPALGYHWGAAGALLPDGLLSAGQVPTPTTLTPIGDPVGGASFSVWQPGETLFGFAPANGAGAAVPGLDLFFTRFGAWSPNSAFLLAPAYYGGRIDTFQPPQPTAAQTQASGWAAAPVLPVRDAALTTLYTTIPSRIDISWSPDGQTLAAWNGGAIIGEGSTALGLYSAKSGRMAASLPIPPAASAQLDTSPSYIGESLRWSADDTRLALMAPELSSLVIWRVK